LLAGFNVQIADLCILRGVGSAVDEELHGFAIFMKVNEPAVWSQVFGRFLKKRRIVFLLRPD